MSKRYQGLGVKYPECGSFHDSGERCDCEQHEAELRKHRAGRKERRRISQNREAVEHAYKEWDFS